MNFQIGQVNLSIWSVTLRPNHPNISIKIKAPLFGKELVINFTAEGGEVIQIEVKARIEGDRNEEEST